MSKRTDAPYRSGPSRTWVKTKNPASEAVRREGEEKWSHPLRTIISAATSSTWRSVLFARFAAIEAGEGGLLTFALTLRSAAILIAAIGSGGHALRQRGGPP